MKILLLFFFSFTLVTIYSQDSGITFPSQYRNKSASELNDIGFEYYSDKNYYDAIDLFKFAIRKDNSYLYANYNLACTLSLIYNPEKIHYYNESLEYLHRSYQINTNRLAKMEGDTDIDPIRNTAGYKSLIDNLKNPLFNTMVSAYDNSYFQYYDDFLYSEDVSLLKIIGSNGKVSFIPLASIILSNINNLGILICDRFTSDGNNFRLQIGKTSSFT